MDGLQEGEIQIVPDLIEQALARHTMLGISQTPTLAEIKELDRWTRQLLLAGAQPAGV